MTEQIAIHCLKAIICEEVCEECELYGQTGTDHCETDAVRIAIEALEKQAEYKSLEEQGLLLRLPCKVGDVLWWKDAYGDLRNSEVNSIFVEQGIDGVIIEALICNISAKELGKTVFLTKEEAEAALEKMKGGAE